MLQAAGIPAGAVLDMAEVFTNVQFEHRRSVAWVDHPEIGPFPHSRGARLLRSGNDCVTGPGPLYREAVDYVVGDLLGKTPEAIDELVSTRVVAREPN